VTIVFPTEFEDEASFYSLGAEYLHAAEILSETPATKINVSMVTFYLLGHAAELLLKSYLFKSGVPLKKLKRDVGHDLRELAVLVQSIGLQPALQLPHILALSKSYRCKSTEYRQLKEMTLPPKDLLLQEVRALSSLVLKQVAMLQSEA
jgi:hypothetical protein